METSQGRQIDRQKLSRRAFMQMTGITAAGLCATRTILGAQAGSCTGSCTGSCAGKAVPHLIPADKQLDPTWLRSLYERGEPEVYTAARGELKYIGLPIGGIGCGQLYLGGDGRLWLWDIFKSNYRREPDHGQRIAAFTLGGHYAQPVAFGEPYTQWNGAQVEQGFLIRIQADGRTVTRTLDQQGFPQVSFRGEYPLGKVTYQDREFPAKVQLEAFSPFIPLNARDSALPATVMSYSVTNMSGQAIEVDLGAWMQNATCPYVSDASLGQRVNRVVKANGRVSLLSTIEPAKKKTADQIVFTDSAPERTGIESKHGYGSSTLTLLHGAEGLSVSAAKTLSDPGSPEGLFEQMGEIETTAVSKSLDESLVGGLAASFALAPGESKTIDFLITWYFPYHNEIDAAPGHLLRTKDFRKLSRHYKPWFKSAGDVASYIAAHKERLLGGTRRWNETWYDSSLPYWLLDRSFIAIDCLASQMFHWFDNGRPYGWEGVDCCPGTCTHVWHYAQALSRIFPELERAFREKVDFNAGIAFDPNSGVIDHRGDFGVGEATDGQAGTILRAYREHLMSKDDAFLRRLWPNIKKAVQFLITKDPDGNGLLEGRQPHTLDAAWYGPMGWISGLYLGALAAGEAMADEMGDRAFAGQCRTLIDRGKKNIVAELFNGEYFIHKHDPKHRALQSGKGCHIDQVLGQAWMHQVGLDRVIPKQETVSALNSLWTYNFAPDAGGYALKHREIEKAFRWYAMPGEAGLLMCTWPQGGATEAIPGDTLRPEKNPEVWTGPGGYFNECMNGFEYQVAWHMVAEGEPGSALVQQGLAIIRAIHERYGASKRNPYNEIECGDHYARSMASYGIFLAACGFEYHGPKGHIGFAPKLSPENFKAAFTAAEGWGTFAQRRQGNTQHETIAVKWGRLSLRSLAFAVPKDLTVNQVKISAAGQVLSGRHDLSDGRLVIELENATTLEAGQAMAVAISH